MNLRVKGDGLSKPQLLQFASSHVTVAELKVRVSEIFQCSNDIEFIRSVQLSMNGKEILSAEDTDSLSSHGFVSGDIVHILRDSSVVRASKCPKLNSIDADNDTDCMETTPGLPSSDFLLPNSELRTVSQPKEESKTTKATQSDNTHHLITGRSHLPLSDTPVSSLPNSYSTLITANPKVSFQSNVEKVAALLHILMIETGFIPQSASITSSLFNTLPESWSLKHDTLKLNYKTGSQVTCTIVVSSIGPVIIVNGIGSAGKSFSLKLKPDAILPPVGGKILKQLSVDFKNEIAFPLYLHIQREAHSTCPAHFSNLPPEISHNILKRLDFKSLCRLSGTSRLFQDLANQPRLWKLLAERDLRGKHEHATSNETVDWKKFYKDEYLLEKKQQDVARSLRDRPRPYNPDPSFYPGPRVYPDGGFGAPEFPGMMGGYSDLHPDLGGFGAPGRRDPFSQGLRIPPPYGPIHDPLRQGIGIPRPFGLPARPERRDPFNQGIGVPPLFGSKPPSRGFPHF